MIKATRVQYPVGQGCFHAGRIKWKLGSKKGDFRFVYDCGSQVGVSKSESALKKSIDAYAENSKKIDALFVSHLDSDHVNGLDYLLTKIGSVDTVFLSHLSLAARVADIVAADPAHAMFRSFVEASLNPAAWFGQRGVSRIVMVAPATPVEGGASDEGGEDVPGGDVPEDAEVSWEARQSGDGVEETRTAVEKEMKAGQMVAPGRGAKGVNWVLVPHVDPVTDDRLDCFKKAVEKALNVQDISKLTTERLVKALRDTRKRKTDKQDIGEQAKLKKCYTSCFSGTHNRISMSVYSGPRFDSKQKWKHGTSPTFVCDDHYVMWKLDNFSDSVGWIGSGDAALDKTATRLSWLQSYRPFECFVSTLLLAHHGSGNDFHSDLLRFPKLFWCIASAGDRSQYGHPGIKVIEEVRISGKIFHHVSERPGTLFCERVSEVSDQVLSEEGDG